MALAQAGRFADASNRQKALIERVQKERSPAVLERLEANLQRYRKGEACRVENNPAVLLP